jgi:hypothetical protein
MDEPLLPKAHILSKLYHELGKQGTDFALQHSRKENDEVIWTKRRTFLTLDPAADQWFIQHCNHRQILRNEIILDFDRPISPENVLADYDVKRIAQQLREDKFRFVVYHSGSKGVHIHLYNDWLLLSTKENRESFRRDFILSCTKLFAVGLDLQKASDATMIALEHTPHWRTGTRKQLLLNMQVDTWM